MATDNAELPESLTELVLAIPDDGWSPDLLAIVERLVQWERREIRSPRHVGLDGTRWDASTAAELGYRCYAHCILGVDPGSDHSRADPTRLDNLRVLAKTEGVGVGFLRRAVQWYLRDLQRSQRPLAVAVFKRLRGAILKLASEGAVSVSAATPSRPGKDADVRFLRSGGERADVPMLTRIVDSCPDREALVRRLGRRGYKPTKEVWALFDHLAASGCGTFKLGDLHEVLAGLVHEPQDLPSEGLDQTPAESEGRAPSAEEVGVREEALFQKIRHVVAGAKGAGAVRQRMLDMLDARRDLVAQPGFEEITLTQLGVACGFKDRRRASETWQRIVELVRSEIGLEIPDKFSDGPSAT